MMKAAWQGLMDFIQEVNTTSTRIIVSLAMAVLLVLTALTMMVFKVPISEGVLGILCGFILSMGGLDVIQYTQKRRTYQAPSTPEAPDANEISNRRVGSEHPGIEPTP